MKLNKAGLIVCCLVGCLCISHAQVLRGGKRSHAKKSSHFNTTHKTRTSKKASSGNWSYRAQAEADLFIGRALRQDQVPQIGGSTSYARKAKLGEKWLPRFSPIVAENLVSRHILEASFPGYITNFMSEFRAFKEGSDLSWTNELSKTLSRYGEAASFAGGFVPTFAEAVEFLERSIFWTHNPKNALDEAWYRGAQTRAGFFVIAVRSPLINGGKDVLLLDPKARRFISIQQSVQAAQHEVSPGYEPMPVGDLRIGREMLTYKLEDGVSAGMLGEPYSTYMVDFGEAFDKTQQVFGVREWIEVLHAYDQNAYYYAQFVYTLDEVVSYYPSFHYVSDYHGVGRHADAGRPFLEEHLYDVVRKARKEQSGFFVVFKMRINERPSIVSRTEEDVLVLDLENKRFISLNESKYLAQQERDPDFVRPTLSPEQAETEHIRHEVFEERGLSGNK